MSLFDYPRINFRGKIELNPGTANNDDYAQQPGAGVAPRQLRSLRGPDSRLDRFQGRPHRTTTVS